MATHVALLRGINLGGRNKVAMADLRTLVAGLGHTGVSTYIQSGNVLFTAPPDADCGVLARAITDAISAALGVSAPVVVVTREELAQIRAANPFPGEPDPKRVHAVVLSEPPGPELAARLDAAVAQSAAKGAEDAATVRGRTLYLHTPGGYGNSDLAAAALRIVSSPKAGVTGTARNWATLSRLLELCEA
ncbi:MAG TPA: DUF1697 domain-containing protein [Trebonia sp.]|nr:DUF1697 domain-containing protein [Trebonia sp.]